jgi:hypothetical protein
MIAALAQHESSSIFAVVFGATLFPLYPRTQRLQRITSEQWMN